MRKEGSEGAAVSITPPAHHPPQESDIRWASRWDTYLKMTDDQIHWFSIVNSVMIVLFLSGMVRGRSSSVPHRDQPPAVSPLAARAQL